jgi:hypothetical protein
LGGENREIDHTASAILDIELGISPYAFFIPKTAKLQFNWSHPILSGPTDNIGDPTQHDHAIPRFETAGG